MLNRLSYFRKGNSLCLIVFLSLCTTFYATTDLKAQSYAPKKLKTEQGGLNRRKASERQRKKKSKGTEKRKSKGLQKAYYKKKSNQTQHPGNIWLDPKPKDFTAIKERVERNPSRTKLKTQKSRKSYFRASSNKTHKSFGSEIVKRQNPKLNYKYSSKAIISNSGNNKIKSPKKNYKKSSRTMQRHKGNIFLQPEAKKKDFNEIKARVDRNPGRTMAKQQNRQKGRAISNSALTQSYRGDINVKAKKGKRQTYKYDSKAIQNSPGSLRARNLKSAESRRKVNSASSAGFSGDLVLPSRNHKRLSNEYNSKTIQKSKGTMRRPPKTPGPQYTASYRGDLKSNDKLGKKQWDKYNANRQAQYSGDLNAKKYNKKTRGNPLISQNFGGIKVYTRGKQRRLSNEYNSKAVQKSKGTVRRPPKTPGPQYAASYRGDLKSNDKLGKKQWDKYNANKQAQFSGELKANKIIKKPRGNPMMSQNLGGIKVYSRSNQKRLEKRDSKITGNYSGNIRARSKKSRNQELQGKSLNLAEYRGEIRSKSSKGKVAQSYGTTYSGNVRAKSRKHKNQELEGKSLNFTGYEGEIAVLSKRKQDKWMMKDSRRIGTYSGNIAGVLPKKRKQELEGKSLNLSEYSGNIKVKNQGRSGSRQPNTNADMAAYQGDVVITARDRKKLEYEYMSRIQHNYSGEIKQKRYSKWLDGRKSRSNTMANFQGNIKITNADMNKNTYEHKSKEMSDFQGNIKMTRSDLKDKQYEHMSKSAHNFSGNLRVKTNSAREKYYRNISDRNQQITGNFRTKTRLAKDIEEQIASAKIHNYQGGPKTSLFTRIWLNLFDKTGKLEKVDDKTREPKYDSREYKIWY